MKKILFILAVMIAAVACNNNTDGGKQDKMQENNNAVADSIPATRSGDTSSYEQMPNRIGDSTGQ